MKSVIFLLHILFCANLMKAADTTVMIKNTGVKIPGNEVSSIQLVNYAGKPIGKLVTFTSITKDSIVFTQFSTSKEDEVDFICIQKIIPSATVGLVQDITIQKSFVNPEMKTNPKQYWDVSIALKKKTGEYVDIGSNTEYRLSYENEKTKAAMEQYSGTSRVIPFKSKAAAEAFVKKVKQLLKK